MNKIKILKANIDLIDHRSVLDSILNLLRNKNYGYICVANVHMCMEVFDDNHYAEIINKAEMAVPDGRPLVWAQKLLGYNNAHQVRGSDLTLNICKEAEKKNIPIGLYGGSDKAIDGFQNFLKNRYPNLKVAYALSPPFRKLSQNEDANVINDINDSGARILFVGLGCPKQEFWMAEHKGKINCIMIGIGAAFDFFGGTKKQAPIIMQQTGTEWLSRLASEPRRLWKRYLKHNPRFVYYFLKQLFTQ